MSEEERNDRELLVSYLNRGWVSWEDVVKMGFGDKYCKEKDFLGVGVVNPEFWIELEDLDEKMGVFSCVNIKSNKIFFEQIKGNFKEWYEGIVFLSAIQLDNKGLENERLGSFLHEGMHGIRNYVNILDRLLGQKLSRTEDYCEGHGPELNKLLRWRGRRGWWGNTILGRRIRDQVGKDYDDGFSYWERYRELEAELFVVLTDGVKNKWGSLPGSKYELWAMMGEWVSLPEDISRELYEHQDEVRDVFFANQSKFQSRRNHLFVQMEEMEKIKKIPGDAFCGLYVGLFLGRTEKFRSRILREVLPAMVGRIMEFVGVEDGMEKMGCGEKRSPLGAREFLSVVIDLRWASENKGKECEEKRMSRSVQRALVESLARRIEKDKVGRVYEVTKMLRVEDAVGVLEEMYPEVLNGKKEQERRGFVGVMQKGMVEGLKERGGIGDE